MESLSKGMLDGLLLLFSGDPEILRIIGLSLTVSVSSTLLAGLIGIPAGLLAGLKRFPGKRLFRAILYALMGIPPVVVGLVVLLLLSRRGPLGQLQLLFSPQAMILAQFLLVLPIIAGIVFGAASREAAALDDLGLTLGGSRFQRFCLLVREMRSTMWLAVASAFGRAISEVGAVMMVGGNIRDKTRVMTTFIALNNNMGEYEKSIAMGVVLLVLSLVLHLLIQHLSGGAHEH